MRILNRLGGIELASSYKCIKAISKKKQSIIDSFHEQFIEGSQKNDMSKDQAQEIWNLIVKFAGYGFNKSHSTAYGAIAYQTAYLKAHYPEEFMAALLSCGMESTDRISEHTDDCRRQGIEIIPPNVNLSDVEFSVVVEGEGDDLTRKLAFGLGAIKGVGESAMHVLVNERNESGPFKNIFDLCERCDPKVVTKGVIETLIKAGALDCLGHNREQHILVLERAVQAAVSKQKDKAMGQMSLFGGGGNGAAQDDDDDITMPVAEDWTHGQKLVAEKEVLGFYLTSHPLTEYAEQIETFTQHTVKDLKDLGDGKDVTLGGMISSIKKAQTKNPSRNGNSKYVNFDLEDAQGVVRCIMWPDDYADAGEKVVADEIVVVKGRIDLRGREPNIIVNKLLTLEEAEKEFTKQVAIRFQNGLHTDEEMKRVRDLLGRYPGRTPVTIVVETNDPKPASNGNGNGHHSSGRLRAVISTSIQVSARPELKEDLRCILGESGFRFQAVPASQR